MEVPNFRSHLTDMIVLGVNFVLRKLGLSVTPTVELLYDGEYYTIQQVTKIRTVIVKFKPGEEFIEETPDGRKTRTIITFENENKLVQEQLDGIPVTIVREFGEDELHMVSFIFSFIFSKN